MNTAPKLLSERLLRYSNELRWPSSGELVALLREAATALCDLSHDDAMVRQSVEHGWVAAALAPPSGEGVDKPRSLQWLEDAAEDRQTPPLCGLDGRELPLDKWEQWARRDDWHLSFVGSDIRQMIGTIRRLHSAATTPQSAPVDGALTQDEIHAALVEITRRIEVCGASPELTHASSLACDLRAAIGDKWNKPAEYGRTNVRRAILTTAPTAAEGQK